eukprot:Gb_08935 [translate_table: standard]
METELVVKIFATVVGVGLVIWALPKRLLGGGGRPRQLSDDHSPTQTSTLSPKAIPTNGRFDVFLSFHGPDTRKTLVGHLFHSLSSAGVVVFLDSETLEKGKTIDMSLEYAIHNSHILIPIFSRNYAYSHWCLNEVSQMSRSNAKLIIPIFYNVRPAEVRYQTGPFEAAFNKHLSKRRANEKTIQEWRNSLKYACSFSGWSLRDDFNGHEIKLVQTLKTEILGKLQRLPLQVARHPVGVEERKNVAMDLLEMKSEGIIISLCIHGMGGVGKSTLAKALFNDLCPKFSSTCFVSDVRKTDTKELQIKIIKSLVNVHGVKMNIPEEGMREMKKHLDPVRALLVLDDVDDRNVLAALLGDWFQPGSRIIVTTQNKGVVDERSKHLNRFYQVEELDHDQALQLFTWHAFPKGVPDYKYRHLSDQVVTACQGLPLAIEVIGGLLFDKRDDKFWMEALKQLKSVEINEIQERLKIGYDVLNDTEKEIFLDIACFFVGSDKYKCLCIWEASGWCANSALNNLRMRSLIKVSSDDRLEMHDILRDMGRSIVTKQNIDDVGKRSRMWDEKDVRKVFKQNRATESIQGILYNSKKRNSFRTEQLEAMHKLRLLSMNNANIEGDFGRLPTSDLRWLRWIDCPFQCFPSEMKIKNLTVLELANSDQIRQIWDEQMHPKVPKNLKILLVKDCRNLNRLPELSKLRSLVKVEIIRCPGLISLPDSIGHLHNLEYLDLSHCSNLQSIPQLPKLQCLLKLMLNHCDSLTALPDSIGKLKNLEVLDLSACTKLESLPEISKLESLIRLEFHGCSNLRTLPNSVGYLINLKHLGLSGCSSINTLPELSKLESLVKLDLHDCIGLKTLPDPIFDYLINLEYLDLSNCSHLEGLPRSIGSLIRLHFLNMQSNFSVTCLPEEFGRLLQLKELDLNHCEKLGELPQSFANLGCLSILRMGGMSKLPGSLCRLGALRILDVRDAGKLVEVDLPEHIGMLKSLEVIDLQGGRFCMLPESFKDLSQLTHLNLNYCRELLELPVLPERLVELSICFCKKLRTVPDLSDLKRLKILRMYKCEQVEELRGLGSLQALEYLDIGGCNNIKSAAEGNGLDTLKSLETLHLGGSGVVFFHKWIQAMPHLWQLSFDGSAIPDWFDQQIQSDITLTLEEKVVRCMGVIFFFSARVGDNLYISASIIRGDREVFRTEFSSSRNFLPWQPIHSCEEELRLFILQENHEFVRNLQNGDTIRVNEDRFLRNSNTKVGIHLLSSTREEITMSGGEQSSEMQKDILYRRLFADLTWIQWSYKAWRNLHPLDLNTRSLAVYDLAGFTRRTIRSKSPGENCIENVAQETVFVRWKRENWLEIRRKQRFWYEDRGELVGVIDGRSGRSRGRELDVCVGERWLRWKRGEAYEWTMHGAVRETRTIQSVERKEFEIDDHEHLISSSSSSTIPIRWPHVDHLFLWVDRSGRRTVWLPFIGLKYKREGHISL